MNLLNRFGISLVILLFTGAAMAGNTFTSSDTAALTTVVQNDEGESLIADSFSRTLYVFDQDQNQAAPTCEAECAELWPPYILTPEEVAGLQAPLGSIMRKNNKPQLTYNGRPVYTYAFDRTEGDDKGDGVGGVWHYIETMDSYRLPPR